MLKRTGSLLAGAGIMSSVATADGTTTDQSPRVSSNYRQVRVSDRIKRFGSGWLMLAGPSDRVYHYIDASDVGPSTQSQLTEAYKKIERDFPVIRRSMDDTTTRIELADDAARPSAADRETKNQLLNVFQAVSRGSAAEDSRDRVRKEWYKPTHNKMFKAAYDSISTSDTDFGDKVTANNWPYKPDVFDSAYPDGAEDALGTNGAAFLANVVQSWRHYRNPGGSALYKFAKSEVPGRFYVPDGSGRAHLEAEQYFDIANSSYASSNKTKAYRNLAYASHYIADVSNPMHAGLEEPQVLDFLSVDNPKQNAIHYVHENWANEVWEDENLSNLVKIYQPENIGSSIKDDVDSMAAKANDDATTIFYDIQFLSEDDWKSSLKSLTKFRLQDGGAYVKGMIEEMEG